MVQNCTTFYSYASHIHLLALIKASKKKIYLAPGSCVHSVSFYNSPCGIEEASMPTHNLLKIGGKSPLNHNENR